MNMNKVRKFMKPLQIGVLGEETWANERDRKIDQDFYKLWEKCKEMVGPSPYFLLLSSFTHTLYCIMSVYYFSGPVQTQLPHSLPAHRSDRLLRSARLLDHLNLRNRMAAFPRCSLLRRRVLGETNNSFFARQNFIPVCVEKGCSYGVGCVSDACGLLDARLFT